MQYQDKSSGSPAQQEADAVVEHGAKLAGELGREADAVLGRAKSGIADTAEEQKTAMTSMFADVADAVQAAAEQLEDKQQGVAADYARSIGSGLSKISETLDRKSAGDMVADLTQLARAHPAAYLGGALLVGLMLARFAKSSASGNDTSKQQDGASIPRQDQS